MIPARIQDTSACKNLVPIQAVSAASAVLDAVIMENDQQMLSLLLQEMEDLKFRIHVASDVPTGLDLTVNLRPPLVVANGSPAGASCKMRYVLQTTAPIKCALEARCRL